MIELFQILTREQGQNPGAVQTFLSSHPAPADRMHALQTDVARAHGGTRNTAKFQAIKAKLLKMSPARAMPNR
jgi:predicted Zn-dependent protease